MKGKKQKKYIISALALSTLLCLAPIQTQAAWKQVNGSWKWSEGSSYVKSDWRKIGNDWYYFNQNGYALTGWKKISGYWYYFNSSCKMQTGWQKIGGTWYYFASNGHMATGWQKIDRVWFYFGSNGKMVTGWQKINGSWYYFEANGHMKTGWLKDGSDWYFLNANGKMAANTWINNTYYMGSNGAMLKSTTTPDGYYVNSSGKWDGKESTRKVFSILSSKDIYLDYPYSGGMNTLLIINADGTFSGESNTGGFDINWPDVAKQNAVWEHTDFTGKFSTPVKVSDYVYSVELLSLNTGRKAGEVYDAYGVVNIETSPYGLMATDKVYETKKGSTFYIYLPGCPSSELKKQAHNKVTDPSDSCYQTLIRDYSKLPDDCYYILNLSCGLAFRTRWDY